MFKKGQSGNPKGAPKGSNGGRPPDWLKQKCQSIIEKSDLIGFLRDVAAGKDIDQAINENGECLKIPAGIKERLKAAEMLLDRGFGKPSQGVELTGKDGDAIIWEVRRFGTPSTTA